MTPPDPQTIAGRTAWLITEVDKRGMDVQVQGVADALGLKWRQLHVKPDKPWRWIAPWGPVSPNEGFGSARSQFAPPWPDFVFGTGRHAIPYVRAVGRHAGHATFRVVLQDPKTSPNIADVIWVPEHDTRRGPNVVTTPTAPHSFSPARLAQLRRELPPKITSLAGPLITIVLGGPNAVFPFGEADQNALIDALENAIPREAGLLITASRRTPRTLVEGLQRSVDRQGWRDRCIFWDPETEAPSAENPYPAFLAAADALVVTGDSVNMCGEAAATGRPVHVFQLTGGSAKFARFHENLAQTGAARAFTPSSDLTAARPYDPVFA
ncbi:MAG: mitochondrial fission ELM1 family protein, partial [Pseudomonadota bacterium]